MPSMVEVTPSVKGERRSPLRRTCRLVRLDGTSSQSGADGWPPWGGGKLVGLDEVGGREDEHLAHHVRVLLIAAHKANHPTTRRALDHRFEALPHQLLKLQALPNDRRAATALQQRLLDAREPPAQHAHNKVVLVIGLHAGGPTSIELLQQRDQPVRDRRQHIAMAVRAARDVSWAHSETLEPSCGKGHQNSQKSALCWKHLARWVLALRLAREPTRRTREKAAMSAPTTTPLTGDDLLVAVTDAMVALHKRYYQRAPVTGKTLLLGGEVLVCVLGGVYTDVEKTMIELQRTTVVLETRSAFQTAMQHKFISAVERLSGRDVVSFISDQHVGPDMEIELFMLEPLNSEADAPLTA